MTKANSKTYDQTNLANRIVERLNKNPQSNLNGLISRNKGLIKYSDISELISYLFIEDKTKNVNSSIISISNFLTENFNMLTEYNTDYLEKKYSYKKLFVIMYCFKYFTQLDKSNMCETIDKMLIQSEKMNSEMFYKPKSKKAIINELDNMIKEVL